MNGWSNQRWRNLLRRRHVATWQLSLIFIVFLLLTVFLLRQNNLQMVRLREAVLVADEQNGDVAGALEKLNAHVFDHMNTKIVRPVELVHSYNRQAKAVIEASLNSGRDVYREATKACEGQGIPLTSIAQCAADYASRNNPGLDPTKIKLPDKNLFIHSFASPKWTPDLAGFSLLITVVIGLWLIGRLVLFITVKLVIHHRLKSGF